MKRKIREENDLSKQINYNSVNDTNGTNPAFKDMPMVIFYN